MEDYIKLYKETKDLSFVLERLSKENASDQEKLIVLSNLVDLSIEKNFNNEICACINCNDALEHGYPCGNGDMFDYMSISVYCKLLNKYVIKNMPLDDSYKVDERGFCPKLKIK